MSDWSMTEIVMYWVGVVTCGAGVVGVVATIAIWSINRLIVFLNFQKALYQGYGTYLREKHRKPHIPG